MKIRKYETKIIKKGTKIMRKISMIVIHCSATRCNQSYTVQQLFHDHVEVNHWRFIGYHYYIRRSGKVEVCRPLDVVGAHAKGHNAYSIGICYEGGLDEHGHDADTRTPAQKKAMAELIIHLKQEFPGIVQLVGHRDLPGVHKACPCFDAKELKKYLWKKSYEEEETAVGKAQEKGVNGNEEENGKEASV